jgi:hypothetical protein
MKLGSQTNSIVNHLYARGTIGQPDPVVGMGVTLLGWTDRNAGTIHAVRLLASKQWSWEIEVTHDASKVVSGSTLDGTADYEYTPRPDGERRVFRFNLKSGMWVCGSINPDTSKFNANKRGSGLRIGERETYYDPSF